MGEADQWWIKGASKPSVRLSLTLQVKALKHNLAVLKERSHALDNLLNADCGVVHAHKLRVFITHSLIIYQSSLVCLI